MPSIFQQTVSGDIDSLGEVSKDSYTGKHIWRCTFSAQNADQWLKLEYASAVVYGFPTGDIDLDAYGEVGYELDGKSFQHTLQFVQSVQNDKAIGQTSQSILLYVPPKAKIYFTIPLFASSGSGASGGGRLSLTGVYLAS
jgi:hypothetical protein